MPQRSCHLPRLGTQARKATALTLLAASLALSAGALAACGGSSNAQVVAIVGKSQITRPMLGHWMQTMVAGDFQELDGEASPEGLVSDPANYPRCVSASKQIPTKTGTRQSDATLHAMCRQLYIAIKEQALSFLISALWASEQASELGQHLGQAEFSRAFQKFSHRQWPNPAQLRQYLNERHRTLSDERYLLKRNLLSEKIVHSLERKAGGGLGNKTFAKVVLAQQAKWISHTSCKPGYRSISCKQYRNESGVAPTAAQLVEHLKSGD